MLFAGSLFAIGVLVALCWALGFRADPRLADAAAAERLADQALTGFHASEVALDRGRRAALLRGHDGRLVLVRPMGDRWLVRLVAGVRRDGDRLVVAGETGGGPSTLTVDEPARWLA